MTFTSDARWCSAGIPNRHAIGEWNRLLSREVTSMAVREAGAPFALSWRRFGFGAIDLNFYSCQPVEVLRSQEMAGRQDVPTLTLAFARQGPMVIGDGNMSYEAPEGAFAMLDESRGYSLRMSEGGVCLSVRMPLPWLRRWVSEPFASVGRAIGENTSWTLPLGGLLTAIADSDMVDVPLARPVLADQIGALLAMLVEPPQEVSAGDSALFRRIVDVLEMTYPDPLLTPDMVAREVGISRRHLHRVMAVAQTTYGSYLTSVRIEHAARLLADRSRAAVRINDIAWTCGFADSSHFARLFRKAKGVSPREYRALRA